MVKAYIETIENNGYLYKVRIPIYHKIKNTPGAIPSEQLPLAPVCTAPGLSPRYQINDVVWVDFENDELGSPVIVGLLYRQDKTDATTDINCDSLNVAVETHLSTSTSVGETSNSLQSLPQLVKNVDELNALVDFLDEEFERKIKDNFYFYIDSDGHLIEHLNDEGELTQYFSFEIDSNGNLIVTETDAPERYSFFINDLNGDLVMSISS